MSHFFSSKYGVVVVGSFFYCMLLVGVGSFFNCEWGLVVVGSFICLKAIFLVRNSFMVGMRSSLHS